MTSSIRGTDSPLDRIRLHRQADKGAILLVEGGPDLRVLAKVLASPPPIFPIGPREAVIRATAELLDGGLGPVVALVDRDFDSFVGDTQARGLPVVAYDGADLESMLWETSALNASLGELGSAEKIEAFGGITQIRAVVDAVIEPLQRLRSFNAERGLGLTFDALDLRRRIKASSLQLNVQGLCDALRHDHPEIPRSELIAAAEGFERPRCPQSGQPLYRGKDRIAALGVALRRQLGSLGHQEAHVDNVSRVLYASVSRETVSDAPWLTSLERRLADS